jgi:hypothetical protein
MEYGKWLNPTAASDIGRYTTVPAQKTKESFRSNKTPKVCLMPYKVHALRFRIQCRYVFRPQLEGNTFLNNIVPGFNGELNGLIGIVVYTSNSDALSRISPFRFEYEIIPIAAGPFDQIIDRVTTFVLGTARIELPGPWGPAYNLRVETVTVNTCDNLKGGLLARFPVD